MMRGSEYVRGTSAVELTGTGRRELHVIRPYGNRNPVLGFIRRTFERSEMLCSLALEDVRGCAYGIFSRFEVIAASVVVSALAVLAIALGA